ncbi:hypothetical protein ZIOFF_009330 [Zingiber officinale]|uniref:Pentatricopeptide repeat-containing protein n=1 Tax=Zingiber officinale TaxID=94328 RepID=A0A8J5HMS9_ZINOF|nr:hypothetical protein ZIOFF_009330 [Zingiber officinale]
MCVFHAHALRGDNCQSKEYKKEYKRLAPPQRRLVHKPLQVKHLWSLSHIQIPTDRPCVHVDGRPGRNLGGVNVACDRENNDIETLDENSELGVVVLREEGSDARYLSTRSDVQHLLTEKPSHNASLRELNYQLRSLLGSASPGLLSAALSFLRGMLSADSTSLPYAATRSIVFSGLAKRSQPLDEESLSLLVEMAKMGYFPPDAFLLPSPCFPSSLPENARPQFCILVSSNARFPLISETSDSETVKGLFSRRTGAAGAWHFFHAVKDAGGSIEAPVCNALLTGLAAIRDFTRMNLLFSEMKVLGVRPIVVTFGTLINHLCKSHRLNDALNMLDAMSSPDSGVSTSTIIFNTLIDELCKAGRIQDGLSLLDKMKSSHVCDPDSATYNSLIDAFCKAAEFDMAHKLLTKMEKERVAVDVVTLNAFGNGMCRHGMIGSALDFFRKKKVEWPEVKVHSLTYNILISASLHSNNVGRATALFDEMIKKGVSSDSMTYCTHLWVDSSCGFCKKKRLDKAFEIHDEMCKVGLRPDIFTYTTLIDAFCKASDFSKADKFLAKMVDDGCKPNVVTYGAMINGLCKAGDLDQAMKIFRSMDVSVVLANVVIYTILIDSYCKNKKVDVATNLFDEMQKQDILPNVKTYTSIFKGFKDHNMFDKAFELMDKMNSQGCKSKYVTMNVLTGWLTAIGETERLRLFVQWMTVSDIDLVNPDV